ncbi:hypothetical protein BRADI_1g70190v3 [Brachypodium distachyon]|uniref:Protein kinase domain-containing protein n=1 Tax=Brachypodium distachyon TaxID=15368 RepID=A0A0Q3KEP2_BRADI|nr:hypothetical protein BRADI_1g70190v3 [Brachypodium distachyon]
MEFAECAATVAQLVDSAGGVVSKIRHVARTARQNKRECVYLANRISTIATALPLLHQQDHEVAQSLVGLSYALKEAHDLIIACCLERQRKTAPLRQLFRAGGHAERFREINARIDSYLILIPLLTHISLIVPSSNHAGVPTIPMVTPGSGSGSSSLQLVRISDGTLCEQWHTPRHLRCRRVSWRMRIEALLGASRAIYYLHHVAVPQIIHRNISSSGILLDASWMPRLSGFGVAVWEVETVTSPGETQLVEVVGVPGYIDPEYSRTGRVCPASEVYSFGVVMLEALTGRPPVAPSSWNINGQENHPMTLVGFALPIIENGNLEDVLDRRPEPELTPRQMEALQLVADTALRCLSPQGRNRPAMSDVVSILDTALGTIRRDELWRIEWQ